MRIDLTTDYDQEDALSDADAWRDVRKAIDVVLSANDSLINTGTLNEMPGKYDDVMYIKVTPERRREASELKVAQINDAVENLKRILGEPGEKITQEDQTPGELSRMQAETKRVDDATAAAIERNGDQPAYAWSMLNGLETEFDAPVSLIYERLELRYCFGTFLAIDDTDQGL
jgi:hypothetical protein